MRKLCLVVLVVSLAAPLLVAQEAVPVSPISVVPHFIRYSGTMPDAPASASVVQVKFSLYGAQTGGEALWSETQQVALDPASRYSIILGSASSAALPSELFDNGQARWLGVTLDGREESPRSLLVAAPYSLKAGDAETLGGHPVSDFKLATNANGKPDTTVDVTSIIAGTGITVTGNGTATPKVGINSTYLDSLGAQFAVLKANNSFTGNQTITGNLLSSGTFTTLNGTSKLKAGGAVDITYANGVYTISLDPTQGEAFGNELWAQVAHTNTFSGLNTFSGGLTASSSTVAVSGTTSGTTTGNAGIEGIALKGSKGTGVYGINSSASAEGPTAITYLGGTAGVWGDSGNVSGQVHAGVLGTADDGAAGFFDANGGDYYTFFIANHNADAYLLFAVNYANSVACNIDNGANLTCDGTVTGTVTGADGKKMKAFGVQSPEEWIEDFGSGQLSHGTASIQLEHEFAAIVNTGVEYHVFITPEGDSEHLYIANKGANGFEVREARGGTSDVAFSYRIVAKRKGHESTRLTEVPKVLDPSESGHSAALSPVGLAKEATTR